MILSDTEIRKRLESWNIWFEITQGKEKYDVLEQIRVPYDLVARCEGRSSLGRLGVIIHSTAGFVDPWFEGTITLEMTNINEIPIKLYVGMRVGQFAFEKIEGIVDQPYDKRKWSKYMQQVLPEQSRINLDIN